jgi:hypothetical protein
MSVAFVPRERHSGLYIASNDDDMVLILSGCGCVIIKVVVVGW